MATWKRNGYVVGSAALKGLSVGYEKFPMKLVAVPDGSAASRLNDTPALTVCSPCQPDLSQVSESSNVTSRMMFCAYVFRLPARKSGCEFCGPTSNGSSAPNPMNFQLWSKNADVESVSPNNAFGPCSRFSRTWPTLNSFVVRLFRTDVQEKLRT